MRKVSAGLAGLIILFAIGFVFAQVGESKHPEPKAEGGGGDDASVERIRDHLFFLASDAMRGRASGSAEYDRAADYVVDELVAYGLPPLFGKTYRQPFTMDRVQFAKEGALVFNSPTGAQRFEVLRDMMFSSVAPEQDWTQPLPWSMLA